MGPIRSASRSAAQHLVTIAALDLPEDAESQLTSMLKLVDDNLSRHIAASQAGNTSHALSSVRESLRGLHRRAQTVRAIGSLTRSTAAATGAAQFSSYCTHLTGISETLFQSTSELMAITDKLERQHNNAIAAGRGVLKAMSSAQKAAEAAAAKRGPGDDAPKHSAEGAISLAQNNLTHLAETSGKSINSEVGNLITLMQFSDQISQRAEHVSELETHPNLARIAAAQRHAMAEDIQTTKNSLNQRVQALRRSLTQVSTALKGGEDIASIEENLTHRALRVEHLSRGNAEVSRTAQIAHDDAEALSNLLTRARNAFEHLEKSARDIADAAINARLLAARAGSGGPALASLAGAVGEQSGQCISDLDSCRTALDLIGTQITSNATQMAEIAETVQSSTEQSRLDLERDRGALSDIKTAVRAALDDVAVLTSTLMRAGKSTAALASIPNQIVGNIPCSSTMPNINTELANQMRAIYSMSREREVHDSICSQSVKPNSAPTNSTDKGPQPPSPSPSPSPPQSEADLLESILF
jgi:DNA repair exonuclease SbcCD ATPase subunit